MNHMSETSRSIRARVVATFTAEPLADVLSFWGAELGLSVEWEFAPYGQVFQDLLGSGDEVGVRVVLVRLADWPASVVTDLEAALRAAAGRGSAPVVVVVCPSPAHEPVEDELVAAVGAVPGVQVVSSTRLATWYPGTTWHAPYTEQIGRMPYSPEGYAALGTAIARCVHAWLTPRPKVIAVDCDNTLWDGVVAEAEVTVPAARQDLQRALVEQVRAGRLLCLCSRNDERDVMAVLRDHPDMVVRPEHVTAVRANWQPKPANLRSLAHELDLGLDTFVFLDDDPVQVAAVRDDVPEVVALRLPADAGAAERFLRHCWPLDAPRVTEEDTRRTLSYRQNREREDLREQSATLADFLDRLELSVDIRPAAADELDRVSQLTHRTSQFNLSGIRRTAGELAGIGDGQCLVADVHDRFGEYGLVGVLVFRTGGDALTADTFLLSCRALGRGVEHRMLAHLGTLATRLGLGEVRLPYTATDRNVPAHDFLADLGGRWQDGELVLPAATAAATRYRPEQAPRRPSTRDDRPARHTPAPSELISRVASELAGPAQVIAAMHARLRGEPDHPPVSVRNKTEAEVVRLWEELLAVPPRSVHDNFFERGGDSFKLVQLMGRVRSEFGVELPATTLFESTLTIADVAAAIDDSANLADTVDLDALADELQFLSHDELRALLETD
jgi:FkbH-like protein